MYYKISHGVKLRDGGTQQYGSMRCLAVDYPKIKENIAQILVVDAKSEKLIDAKKAFYVIGSDTYGPTGKEFIPFCTFKSAQTFLKDHKGTEILAFSKISEALVYG